MDKIISGLDNLITQQLHEISKLKNQVEIQKQEKDDQLIEIARLIIESIDAFDNSEAAIWDRNAEISDDIAKTMRRYAGVKRKLINTLGKFSIQPAEFPNNTCIDEISETIETKPDSSKKNGEILDILLPGYVRSGIPIRRAQLVVVKN